MLSNIVSTNLKILTLGARDHAMLLEGREDACLATFREADHVCHVCGVRTVDGLEIDHTAGHVAGVTKGLRAICQFCHDLKHPLWAASHGRLVPIWAPGIAQRDLHRLSWAILTWREAFPDAIAPVRAGLLARADRFADTFECGSAEALFEAAFMTCDELGMEHGKATLNKVDQTLRFVPREVLLAPEDIGSVLIDQASRLSTWRIGGFRKIARMTAGDMATDHDPKGPVAGEIIAQTLQGESSEAAS